MLLDECCAEIILKSHGGKVAFRDNLKQQDVSQLGTGEPIFNGSKLQGAKLK